MLTDEAILEIVREHATFKTYGVNLIDWPQMLAIARAFAQRRQEQEPVARCTAVRCTCRPHQMLTCRHMHDDSEQSRLEIADTEGTGQIK